VTALGALVALITLPETHNLRRPESAATAGRPAAVTALRLNGRLWAAVILQGMNRFVFSGVMSATIALLVQEQLKNPSPLLGVATLTGIVMAGRTFVSMSAAPLCGTASDLLKSRWLVTAAAVAAGLVGVLLMAQANAIGLLAGIILTSIASGGIQVMTTTLTGDLVSHAQRGRAIGLLHTSGDFGSAVGPMIAYAFLPFLALQGVYIMCGVLLAGGLALALWFQLQSAISMTR
jgi:MFS family permease